MTLEVSMCVFIVNYVKNLKMSERIVCGVLIICLLVCITIILGLTLTIEDNENSDDIITGRMISREMWLAKSVNQTGLKIKPVRLVIIHHSVSNECTQLARCAAELRNLQDYFIRHTSFRDIPYNFLIGNDGRCYEGRGWGVEGAHTLNYNKCSIGIGFIGDYRESHVTPQQVESTQNLLLYGIEQGYLHPSYVIAGGKDLRPTESPGDNLYSTIGTWPHYDGARYANKSCKVIEDNTN